MKQGYLREGTNDKLTKFRRPKSSTQPYKIASQVLNGLDLRKALQYASTLYGRPQTCFKKKSLFG
jgi:hypothetical protein